ncbi:MAG TPA: IPT/TIG domain-containing protein [Bryobacteraceae bacterium]|nr:IPT/TIG domain-containing protein [Bryobacteraceae bacterium]
MRTTILLAAVLSITLAARAQQPAVAGCAVFPANNVWNTPIDKLPLDANSASYVATIGTSKPAHPDFGSGLWDGGPIGIPFIDVPGTQPKVAVTFQYDSESDHGGYPIPPNAPIEGGSSSTGDRHVLVIDHDNCVLYELYSGYPQPDGSWQAGSGAIFDLKSNALRPAGWTSADAAGLPIFPGLVRYNEVASGAIRHAIRFTAPQTRDTYIWPGRHEASNLGGANYPPMGQRFRLKAGFDISGFAAPVQVILQALKTYGMILADNGSSWYLSGAPDDRWDNDVLHQITQLQGSDFEAVDESSLMVQADSAQSSAAAPPAIGAIVNAGSFLSSAISPGEILSIFGSGFGSDARTTKVTFDGAAGPLLFVSPGQINVVAPYEIAGKASTTVSVTIAGTSSAPDVMPVAAAAPGIFIVLNQNYTVNSAARPAASNSVLILYATGEGQTNPNGVDGQIATRVWPAPVLPVAVTIGGQDARVRYAGAAPDFIAGALQINAQLPAGLANTTVPLVVHIGGYASQTVNVAIGH